MTSAITTARITMEAWALGGIERETAALAALGDAATPAHRSITRRIVESLRDSIRREKELAAAGHWWCVDTVTGLHLVVPHGPRDNGGFGPVNVWDGHAFVGITCRQRAHTDGWCEHGSAAGEWRTA